MPEVDMTTSAVLVIAGRITHKDGTPASGATVEAFALNPEDPMDRRATTGTRADSDGRYELRMQDEMLVLLKITAAGSATKSLPILDSIAQMQGLRHRGVRTTVADATLEPASSLRGRVTDDHGAPVSGAAIAAKSGSQSRGFSPWLAITTCTAASDGTFMLTDLAAGPVLLAVDSERLVPAVVKASAPAENLGVTLKSSGCTIEGAVTLKSTAEPVSGATVALRFTSEGVDTTGLLPERKVLTDDMGTFRFQQLAAGFFQLTVEKDHLVQVPTQDPMPQMARLRDGESTTGVSLLMYEGQTVKGRATEFHGGKPLEGVKITAVRRKNDRQNASAQTAADGTYCLAGVAPFYGLMVPLRAEKKGYVMAPAEGAPRGIANTRIVKVNPDVAEATADIAMIPAVTISGKITTVDGTPVPDATVNQLAMYTPWNAEQGTPVDESGAYVIEVAPRSTVRMVATSPRFAPSYTDEIHIADQPVTNTNIMLEEAAEIVGLVVDDRSNPVADATVKATMKSKTPMVQAEVPVAAAVTDTSGVFTMSRMPPREVLSLTVESEKLAPCPAQVITLTPGEVKRGVKFIMGQGHFIAGRVTDADGAPVAGADVDVYTDDLAITAFGKRETTASDGTYRVEGIPDARFQVRASHADYMTTPSRLADPDSADVDFVLAKPGLVTLIGQVVDSHSGEAVAGFDVQVDDLRGQRGDAPTVEKDPAAAGKFVIKNLRQDGFYRLQIKSSTYATLSVDRLVIPPDQKEFEKEFKLSKAGSVTGRVVERGTKTPVAGVEVLLFPFSQGGRGSADSALASAKTGADGRFTLKGAGTGNNTVNFTPPQPYAFFTQDVVVESDREADMGDIELGKGATIKGKLVRVPGDQPIAGAAVQLISQQNSEQSKSATTDAKGEFEFTGLSAGFHMVRVPDYAVDTRVSLAVDETRELLLQVGQASLRGLVLKEGVPLANAGVHLLLGSVYSASGQYQQTGEDGRFEIERIAPGRWTVNISDPTGNSSFQEQVNIPEEGVVEKTFELKSNRLVGKVVDENDEPVAGAKVSVPRSPGTSTFESFLPASTINVETAADGSFVIPGLEARSYPIRASKEKVGLAELPAVSVPEQGDSEPVILKLRMVPTGTLVSTALNMSTGGPIKDAWCYLSNQGGRYAHSAERGDDGVMTIENIPAGSYQAQVSSWGFSTNEHAVEIKAGETVKLNDVLYEAGAVRLAVQDANGSALPGAAVHTQPDDPNSIEKPRDNVSTPDGMCAVRGLYPGSYTITVTAANKKPTTVKANIVAHQVVDMMAKVE